MKIAITGHSSGIGADIYGKLVDDPGFEVRGYSKSNGWNIAEEVSIFKENTKPNFVDVFKTIG